MAYRPRPTLTEEPCERTLCRWGATCLPTDDGNTKCACPVECPDDLEPVCSTSFKTYRNHCQLRKDACEKKLNIRVRYLGECESADPCLKHKCTIGSKCTISANGKTAYCVCPTNCPVVLDRTVVCGSDGREYESKCELEKMACESEMNITLKYIGKCDPCVDLSCQDPQICILDEHRNPACRCDEICELEINPICGSDGKTYANECDMRQESCRMRQQIRIIYRGKCSSGDHPCSSLICGAGEHCSVDRRGVARCSCGPSCEPHYRPVCSSDGRTFDSHCELTRMACISNQPIDVAYTGVCEKTSACSEVQCAWGGSCSARGGRASCSCPTCTGALAPVCADDNNTYGNECKMRAHACNTALNLTVNYEGACETCEEKKCNFFSVCNINSVSGRPECVCPGSCDSVNFSEEPGLNLENLKVCGSDGITYDSECYLRNKACTEASNITIAFRGPCELCSDVQCKYGARCSAGECICPTNCSEEDPIVPEPVCSNTMVTYASECELQRAACHLPAGNQLHVMFYGDCKDRFAALAPPTLLRQSPQRDETPALLCEISKFGCCPDKKTSAQSPLMLGCPPQCNCNTLGSLSEQCDNATLRCRCKPGVGGDNCDRCQAGFWGLPKITYGQFGCIPCGCSVFGSMREDCEQMTGQCVCKTAIEGQKCTKCSNPSDILGPSGCISNVSTHISPTLCTDIICHFGAMCLEIGDRSPVCHCPPTNCSIEAPVCANNGRTYRSECNLRQEACQTQTDLVVYSLGRCKGFTEESFPPYRVTQQDESSPSKSTRHLSNPDIRYYYSNDLRNGIIVKENKTGEVLLTSVGVGDVGSLLGDLCSDDADCLSLGGVYCSNYACLCLPGYRPRDDRKGCTETISLSNEVHVICSPNPCQNGGSCSSIGSGQRVCVCDESFTGQNCENKLGKVPAIEVASFGGNSLIQLNPLKAYHKLNIDVEMKVFSESGLILYDQQRADGRGDFVSLALVNGFVEFRYNLGDGTVILKSPEKLIIDEYYKISAKRYQKDGILSVSGMDDVIGKSEGNLKYLDLKEDTYIGKIPTNFTKVYSNIGTSLGLNGCIKHLRVIRLQVTRRLDNFSATVNGQIKKVENVSECGNMSCFAGECIHQNDPCQSNPCGISDDVACESSSTGSYLCRCIFGGSLAKEDNSCANDNIIHTEMFVPSFDGNSLLIHPKLDGLEKTFRIEVWFLTRKASGMLFYSAQTVIGKGDFVSLNLKDSYLQLRYNLGSGVANLTYTSPIAKDIWHKVIVTRIGRKASMQLNNFPEQDVQSPGHLADLNLNTAVFIGSLPNNVKPHRFSSVKNSFVGAIQRIIVNRKSLNFYHPSLPICSSTPTDVVPCTSSGISRYLDYPCGINANPCQHGGTCLPILNEYKCMCRDGVLGRNCENDASSNDNITVDTSSRLNEILRLDGYTSYVYKHKTLRRGLRIRRGLRFEIMLRTDQESGLLLWKKHGKTDTFSIKINEGLVEVIYSEKHISDSSTFRFNKVVSNIRIDDGLWHTVLAKRRKRLVLVQVDNNPAVRAYSNEVFTSSANAKVWLGGSPVSPLRKTFSNDGGFKGCVTNFKVNGQHIDVLKPMNGKDNIEIC